MKKLVFNPSLSLEVRLTARRRETPIVDLELNPGADAAFIEAVLQLLAAKDGELAVDDETFDRMLTTHVLIPEDELAPGVEPFRCELAPCLLDLAPIDDLDSARRTLDDREELIVNPRIYLQTEAKMPDAIRDRVLLGDALRAHVRPRVIEPGGFIGGPPVAWVENPRTGTLAPYSLAGPWGESLRSLLVDGAAVADQPAEALLAFLLADIVASRKTLDQANDTALRRSAAERLDDDKHVVVRRLFSPLLVAAARRHYRALWRAGCLQEDKQQVIGKRDGAYCDELTMFLQHQACQFLNSIVPEAIRPSYTWVFRYRSGAVLERHVDRPQCRWNGSLAIDAEPDQGRAASWPLFFEVSGEAREARLGLGDVAFYSGTQTPHWRDALPNGQSYTACFLHYVPATFSGGLG